MTSTILGTIITVKAVQMIMLGMFLGNGANVFKKKEVAKSWSVTQFLEESRFVK